MLNKHNFPTEYSICSKTDVFNFLSHINDTSGFFSKEKNFKTYFPQLYDDFKKNEFPDFTYKWKFSQKLYHFLQDDNEFKIGLCKICKTNRCRFASFKKGYHCYCSLQCLGKSQERQEKIQSTNLKLYGYKNPMQNKDIRLKAEQTNLKNLGVKHPLQSKEIQNKWKETNLKLYGHEYNVASEHCKHKRKETNIANYGCENVFQSEQIKEKIKETNMSVYGVEYPLQNKDIQEKWKHTNLETYGYEYSINAPKIQEKVKQTNLHNYGCENVFQSEKIKKKILSTNIKKYGVKNYAQTNEFAKQHRKSIEYDGLTFDSSWEVIVYKFCRYNNIDCVYQPNKQIIYNHKGEEHIYQPDFLINGILYEVKGDHFFDGDKMINPYDRTQDSLFESKHQCMKKHNIRILRQTDIDKLKNGINIF